MNTYTMSDDPSIRSTQPIDIRIETIRHDLANIDIELQETDI